MRDCADMQRIAISLLWFAAFLCMHEIAWSLMGSPRELGVVLGLLAAAFVYFDPKHMFASNAGTSTQSVAR
jgi:hypothetical protein